uniref:Uncharacterized protein n=1 Tax=Arundo donax TaxID=35708 RepID=A0A0A9B526_ARUDO
MARRFPWIHQFKLHCITLQHVKHIPSALAH